MTQSFPKCDLKFTPHPAQSSGSETSRSVAAETPSNGRWKLSDLASSKHLWPLQRISTVATQSLLTRRFGLKEWKIRWWDALSLRSKAITLTIMMGIIPVSVVGGIAYSSASRSLTQQIIAEQENRTLDIRHAVKDVVTDIVEDTETITQSPLLANTQLSRQATVEQKVALLNSFIDARNGRYDSIVVFNLQGTMLFQSKSFHPWKSTDNYGHREYFKRAIATQSPTINNPKGSTSSGRISLEVAAPIKEVETGKVLGIARLRMPLIHLDNTFSYIKAQGWEYKVVGADGKVFAADEEEVVNHDPQADYPDLLKLKSKVLRLSAPHELEAGKSPISTATIWDQNDRELSLVSFTPIREIQGLLEPGWELVVSRSANHAFSPLHNLRWTLWMGTGVTIVLAVAISILLAKRVTRPILDATQAVTEIGGGQLDTRLTVRGQDEFATLGRCINGMAEHLGRLVQLKSAEVSRSHLLREISLKIAGAVDRKSISTLAVDEIRKALAADRVLICSLNVDRTATIAAESLTGPWPQNLGTLLSGFHAIYSSQCKRGQVQIIHNLSTAGLPQDALQQWETLSVKAALIAPIIVNNKLFGALMVHQCSGPRTWKQSEIDFLAQLVTQVELAIDRAYLLEQQQESREQLQKRAMELLMEVDPISKGDLTIRAKVTEDEIGTIADSYNSTVESLQRLVIQVQSAANQVETTACSSESFTDILLTKAQQQSDAMAAAHEHIQAMTQSAQFVVMSAENAKTAVQQATVTVEAGDAVMNRTVEGIQTIRDTVSETTKKVKRLGESSQKIYKVVSLISQFSEQTNLLAMNASIEAVRAGEMGRGFAAVADQVRSLAQQSAKASAEIEKLVTTIQQETNEVATAMEAGTEQVVIGTQLVGETRLSLNQITEAAAQIHHWVTTIAETAIEQSNDSKSVNQAITGVTEIAKQTSQSATTVSVSFNELLAVARSLQTSVGQFKVQ